MRNQAKPPRESAAQGVLRALRVLDVLLGSPEGVRLAEVARQAGLSTRTTHRLLATLVQAGAAEQEGRGHRYRAGRRLVTAAARFVHGLDLVAAAKPEMERLADRFNETVHLAVLDGDVSLDLHAIESTRSVRVCNPQGGRFPVHTSSTGKVLLAWAAPEVRKQVLARPLQRFTPHTIATPEGWQRELSRIRSTGHAVDNREFDLQTWCTAAPVFNSRGECVAALGLSAVAPRMDAVRRREATERVMQAAGAISRSLGWSPAVGRGAESAVGPGPGRDAAEPTERRRRSAILSIRG